MTPYDKAVEKFKKAAHDFGKAAYAVTNAWEEVNDAGGEAGIFSEKYPFTESFDDVAIKIAQWANEVNNQGRSVLDWYPR